MSTKLAIIIPAYKDVFLFKTLESIAKQTDKNFNLYICNDNSPYNIDRVLNVFSRKYQIPYKYIKFRENLGGKDLVAHWNRCIEQIEDEEWIWLFSDDDMFENKCVEIVNKAICTNISEDVIHLNISIIDKYDRLYRECNPYKSHLSSGEFFEKLYSGKIDARMPEFVFRRKVLEDKGKFVSFDLAWRSDNATIINCGYPNGIKTLSDIGTKVLWRYSDDNISAKYDDDMSSRKDKSTVNFFNWLDEFDKKNDILSISKYMMIKFIVTSLLKLKKTYNLKQIWNISKEFNYVKSFTDNILFIVWVYIFHLKRLIK